MKVNWKKVWKEFNEWWDNHQWDKSCKDDWERQKKQIQKIVNSQLSK